MRDTVNWLVLLVVLAVAGGGIYYQYENTRPCANPIPYALGAVDSRFGIQDGALLETAASAAEIWGSAAGKPLFTYDPEAKLKINLVYDEREENAQLGAQIAREQAEQDVARAELETLRAEFLAAETAYNRKVRRINARGGATPSEAAALNQERAELQRLADSVNAGAALFNKQIAALNAKIREYNQLAGRVFEQGQYVRDGSGERINIYQFVNNSQLKRVLAHEFGHAVGLDHNDDPDAIMYAQNESGNLTPTEADLASLRAVCGLD